MLIAICDDQDYYREDIMEHCKRVLEGEDVIFRCFASGEELLCSEHQYDFLFLDIEMDGIDGIQLKNMLELKNIQTKIIFLTSHDERMIDAFGTNVIGFLRKPVQEKALMQIIEKMKLLAGKETIEWECDGKMYAVQAEDILYIEAQDKYTNIVIRENKHLVRRSLTSWEHLLPENDFVRVNRSYLVNLCLLDSIKSEILIEEGKTIPISRKYRKEIHEKYKKYLRKQMERM